MVGFIDIIKDEQYIKKLCIIVVRNEGLTIDVYSDEKISLYIEYENLLEFSFADKNYKPNKEFDNMPDEIIIKYRDEQGSVESINYYLNTESKKLNQKALKDLDMFALVNKKMSAA